MATTIIARWQSWITQFEPVVVFRTDIHQRRISSNFVTRLNRAILNVLSLFVLNADFRKVLYSWSVSIENSLHRFIKVHAQIQQFVRCFLSYNFLIEIICFNLVECDKFDWVASMGKHKNERVTWRARRGWIYSDVFAVPHARCDTRKTHFERTNGF
jgi:hypothetical protein